MKSEQRTLSQRSRALCAVGALLLVPVGVYGGFVVDPPLPWSGRAPLILLIVCGVSLAVVALTGRRSALVEVLIEASWFPF